MNLGPAELLIVLAIVLLIFGGAQLPKLARSLGRAHNELRAGLADGAGAGADAHPLETNVR